ncbi:hypothetical protein SKAU_G00258720 [Synaphobranchus kaupii]|uniref:Uncharacterized protein n=1 Tax=Synaphobranchus kaupii TaxID=118154 RepID=A0A9Q1F497_SYNKA|nr:hypothetical protein SKAU_G00258720 [Synaphobranchus kaupii]
MGILASPQWEGGPETPPTYRWQNYNETLKKPEKATVSQRNQHLSRFRLKLFKNYTVLSHPATLLQGGSKSHDPERATRILPPPLLPADVQSAVVGG